MDNFDNSDNLFTVLTMPKILDNFDNDNASDNPWDLWHLRHWLQLWQLRSWIHDNLCYLTIKSDTGRHRQFLRCFLSCKSYSRLKKVAKPFLWISTEWNLSILSIEYCDLEERNPCEDNLRKRNQQDTSLSSPLASEDLCRAPPTTVETRLDLNRPHFQRTSSSSISLSS